MTAPHLCTICSTPIRRERGEREELWLSRKACSLTCRDQLRSRTQLARAEARLAKAVTTWRPGSATSSHAQLHGIKHEALKEALRAAGHRLAGAPVKVAALEREKEKEKEKRQREKGGPPRDFLLEALTRAYGPRRATTPTSPARAAARSGVS